MATEPRLLVTALLCLACLGCQDKPRAAKGPVDPENYDLYEFFTDLEKVESIELFSVHPGEFEWPKFLPPPEFPPVTETRLRGFRTFGSTRVTDRKLCQQVIREFREEYFDPNTGFAFCFLPRHGLRVSHAGRTTDILICFQCDKFKAYYKDYLVEETMGDELRHLLNRLLTEAGVPLAPGAEWPLEDATDEEDAVEEDAAE